MNPTPIPTGRAALTGTPERLRPALPSDWPAIARLLTESGLPLDGAEAHLPDFVVAERDGALVGCAAMEPYGGAGLLRSVAVQPGARGAGIGGTVVAACLDRAQRVGMSTVVLLTTTAEEYFLRLGFRRITRAEAPAAVHASVEFRGACPDSAVVMALELGGGGARFAAPP